MARTLWGQTASGADAAGQAALALAQLNRGDYKLAQDTAQQALSIVEINHQQESLDGAAALVAMGTVMQAEARNAGAEKMLSHALAIRRRLLGSDDPLIAYTLNNLALVYRQQGRLAEAACLYQRAIEIYARQPVAKGMLTALINLGRVLADQGDSKQAEQLFRRAIASAEAARVDEPEIAVAMSNLGNLLAARHKFDEAGRLLEQAVALDRRSFPPAHARIGFDLNNAGHLAFERKRYGEAERLFTESAAILERALPANHPDTGRVLANLAQVYRTQKRLEESEAAYRKALGILEQAWGPENLQLLPTLTAYSEVLRARQEFAAAEAMEVRSTRIRVAEALRSGE